jgi:branched-subunit amino acid transport protein
MKADVFLYIIGMAVVTYLVRVLPLTLIRKEIKNTFIKSFLYYVPYVTLSVMVFPAILEATSSTWSALVGFIVAILLAYFGGSLFKVSLLACLAVFVMELFV